MSKILNKFLIILCLMLFLPLVFCSTSYQSLADATVDYIKYSVAIKEDGKVIESLILSCELPSTYNFIEKEAFKIHLVGYLNLDLSEKKEKINAIYQQSNQEDYNPETEIVFGDKGQAVQGVNYVGYSIEYSSTNVYRYYSNNVYSYKEGFLLDKSSVVLDNPFNDVYEDNGSYKTYADKYKGYYLSACEGFTFESYVKQKYTPYLYFDYMTLSHRAKSTATTVMKDNENFYHHIWVSDNANLATDQEMKVTLNVIHAGWWYLFGVSIPLVIMIISIIFIKINKKSRKKVEINQNNNI